MLSQPWPIFAYHPLVRGAAAACEMVARAGMGHERPPFGTKSVVIASETVAVREAVGARHPFCTLRHFKKEEVAPPGPRVLVVAPVWGHFATVRRDPEETVLQDHE